MSHKDAGWYDCQVNTSPKISNKSYLSVTEFDPLAVQEPSAANVEKQQDSPVQHGQVIPQIQEFLLRGGGEKLDFVCWLGHLKMSFYYPTSQRRAGGWLVYFLYINL